MVPEQAESGWEFTGMDGTFRLDAPHNTSYLYFPLVNEVGMMSVVTPTLHGDIKTGQNTFYSLPLSAEDLHNTRSARNFWVHLAGYGPWSLTGNSAAQNADRYGQTAEQVLLEAGLLWHKISRQNNQLGLKAEVTNLVPASEDRVELMHVSLTNLGTQAQTFTPTAAIPIFGRSADNLRDHRHVTSLLHRILCIKHGVLVQPSLSFDERGHVPNRTVYALLGCDGKGKPPEAFFPILADFIGEGGNLEWPLAIVINEEAPANAGTRAAGYEALGGLRFGPVRLQPGESSSWILILAILENSESSEALIGSYGSEEKFQYWFSETRRFWQAELRSLQVETGDSDFDNWLRWVALQPILRRLFGNSFLPYHDYGRGGRGWRDLWQDKLALLLAEPDKVAEELLSNLAGVRIDGSNATIIGSQIGEFKADRNEISRVWMDHGAWPFLAIKLYIDQSGDLEFMLREQTYFKDGHTHWAKSIDRSWSADSGTQLRTIQGEIYRGTVLEHLLIEHLSAFFNVGDHNNLRLEDADWNDGLDMATHQGESVAFSALYANNLQQLADLILQLDTIGVHTVSLASELIPLLDRLGEPVDYEKPADRRQRLSTYFHMVEKTVCGRRQEVSTEALASDLRAKADHLGTHIRVNEWIEDQQGFGWFNGYYDNDGRRLEGNHPLGIRMTLSGQVFTMMGFIATDEQLQKMVRATDHYLFDEELGGYRLNTDFNEVLLSLGRATAFAYGHKENGAVFNHMAVMYAKALYQRGLVENGYKVLETIYRHSSNFMVSCIYPGIPEYFNDRGRGMYPYLTGSASWYLLTIVTEVFGVRGNRGDLLLMPKLLKKQFDSHGRAAIYTLFAGQRLVVSYLNPHALNSGEYAVQEVLLDGEKVMFEAVGRGARIARQSISSLSIDSEHHLEIKLKHSPKDHNGQQD